jgi:putative lipoprotein
MRTLIPTLLFFVLASHCHGQVERDKALHFLGGNLFGLAGAGIAKQASDGNRIWTFVGSVAGSTLIGLAKETVDAGQRENGWDNDDLAATILGGVTVGVTIDLFSKKDDRRRLRGRYSKLNLKKKKQFFQPASEFVVLEGKLPSLNTLGLSNQQLTTK